MKAALLVAHGPAIRLRRGSKQPDGRRWETSTDTAVVDSWLQLGFNIGVITDELTVLDVDGLPGRRSLRTMPGLPCGPTVRTPRGMHAYFQPAGLGSSAGALGIGLDIRARGGYVVAPPSNVNGVRYEWLRPASPLPDPPDWMLRRLANATRIDTGSPCVKQATPAAVQEILALASAQVAALPCGQRFAGERSIYMRTARQLHRAGCNLRDHSEFLASSSTRPFTEAHRLVMSVVLHVERHP